MFIEYDSRSTFLCNLWNFSVCAFIEFVLCFCVDTFLISLEYFTSTYAQHSYKHKTQAMPPWEGTKIFIPAKTLIEVDIPQEHSIECLS